MKRTVAKTDSQLVAATEIAAEIAGTEGVANELTVRTRGVTSPNDTEIAAAVRTALKWDIDLPGDKIAVVVRLGTVTLKGSVDYWYQKRAAVDRVIALAGVSAINNRITVVPPVISDREITTYIENAIKRRIRIAARHINVDVKDGIVTLAGNVQLYSDRALAERTAWMTEGVRTVVNKLVAIR